jgi:hypothetical protein
MVECHLEARQIRRGERDGECGAVVVRVAMFVGVSEQGGDVREVGTEALDQFGQIVRGFLVWDAVADPRCAHAEPVQRGPEFRLARAGIGATIQKACPVRVTAVAGRASGQVDEGEALEIGEAAAEAHYFIVGCATTRATGSGIERPA